MNKLNRIIIDVRTPEEFQSGHVKGSFNFPLMEIIERIDEIKSYGQTILLCCASGNRSGQAAMLLERLGLTCENGGSWRDVEKMLQN